MERVLCDHLFAAGHLNRHGRHIEQTLKHFTPFDHEINYDIYARRSHTIPMWKRGSSV